MSSFADCYVDCEGNQNHAHKSRFLKYTTRSNKDITYVWNDISSATGTQHVVSRTINGTVMPEYFSFQLDVMNAPLYRGDYGEGGTALQSVVTGKMRNNLKPGGRSHKQTS